MIKESIVSMLARYRRVNIAIRLTCIF